MTAAASEKTKARPNEIRAVDRLRRARRVTLDALAQRFPRSETWLSRALAGYLPMTRGQIRALRQAILELSRNRT